MPIVTKPTALFVQGEPLEFTLNKLDLAAHPIVVAHPYFSDASNWNLIYIIMQSTDETQQIIIKFNAEDDPCVGDFEASIVSKDSFEVQFLQIIDFDGGSLLLENEDLVPSEFSVTKAAVVFPLVEKFDTTPDYVITYAGMSVSGGVLNYGVLPFLTTHVNPYDPNQSADFIIDLSGTPFSGAITNLVETHGLTNNYSSGNNITIQFDVTDFVPASIVGSPAESKTCFFLFAGDKDDLDGAGVSSYQEITGVDTYTMTLTSNDLAAMSNPNLAALALKMYHYLDSGYTVTIDVGPIVTIDNVVFTLS
jgi:hypothetical protein